MTQLVVSIALTIAVFAAPTVWAQEAAEEAGVAVTGTITASQMIRNAGYNLTNEEAAYLDADERVMERFLTALLAVDYQSNLVNEPAIRQVVLEQLRQLVSLNAAETPVAPPASMEALHRVAQARRTATQQAARAWLEGLEANDPNWVLRGSDAYGRARQGEADWYSALRERLLAQGAAPSAPAVGQQPAQPPR